MQLIGNIYQDSFKFVQLLLSDGPFLEVIYPENAFGDEHCNQDSSFSEQTDISKYPFWMLYSYHSLNSDGTPYVLPPENEMAGDQIARACSPIFQRVDGVFVERYGVLCTGFYFSKLTQSLITKRPSYNGYYIIAYGTIQLLIGDGPEEAIKLLCGSTTKCDLFTVPALGSFLREGYINGLSFTSKI